MHFDFKRLSPADLEDLTKDIFQKVLNVKLENFSSGPDNGIDVRYSSANEKNEIVIQCKHYANWNDLLPTLEKEALKVKLLKPKRYILVTTLGLTPDRKDKIIELFKPYLKNSSDIWGEKDLTMVLNEKIYADILKKHLKLWLDSSIILEHILESNIAKILIKLPEIFKKIIYSTEYNRALIQKQKIEESLKVFVQNKSLNESLELLHKNNYCIISGAPGIGKTTLANMLIYHFMHQGYELIQISKDMDEANKLFNAKRKQIFYYDDFLGSNFLEDGLSKNEDQRIIDFIDRVSRLKNKKLVFTTREYILNQAIAKYSKFNKGVGDSQLIFSKCIIDLKDYTKLDRARIIYNHWCHANIPKKIKDDILKQNLYHGLIEHKNFNPRVIQWISKNKNFEQFKNGSEYIENAKNLLNNPYALWEGAFNNQISESSRNLLFCLVSLSPGATIDLLKRAWTELQKYKKDKYGITWSTDDFEKSLKELEGSFIKIDKIHSLVINLSDPSIKDFLAKKIRNDTSLIMDLLKSSIVWSQTKYIFYATMNSGWDFKKSDETKKVIWDNDEILALIKENFYKESDETAEQKLYWIANRELNIGNFLKTKFEEIKEAPKNKEYFLAFLTILPNLENFQHEKFINEYLENVSAYDLKNLADIVSISDLKDYLNINNINFLLFKEKADKSTEELIDLADYNRDSYEIESAFETAETLERYFDLPKTASKHIGGIINRMEESNDNPDKETSYEDYYDYAHDQAMNEKMTIENIENLFNAGF